MQKVIVIGGGAAGLMAAVTAAQNGAEVLLLEKKRPPGQKAFNYGKRPLQCYEYGGASGFCEEYSG